jgi:hypothetical protein
MPLTIARSTPFRRVLNQIGHSTYRLNTILVGLRCVAEGGGDGGAIAVTWAKPKPEMAGQVADQARIYACAGALAYAADVIDVFLRNFVKEEWLGFTDVTKDIATRASTGSGGHAWSFSERAAAICNELGLKEPIRLAALELLAAWRNVTIHSAPRKQSKETEKRVAEIRKTLTEAKRDIHNRYSHFDVDLAFKNFDARKTPVPKEVTTLIAISVNLMRAMDEAAIKRAAPDPDRMVTATEQAIGSYLTDAPERKISGWSELSDAWQGSPERRRNMLMKIMANCGIAELKHPVSAILPPQFVEDLLVLSRDEVSARFSLTPPP